MSLILANIEDIVDIRQWWRTGSYGTIYFTRDQLSQAMPVIYNLPSSHFNEFRLDFRRPLISLESFLKERWKLTYFFAKKVRLERFSLRLLLPAPRMSFLMKSNRKNVVNMYRVVLHDSTRVPFPSFIYRVVHIIINTKLQSHIFLHKQTIQPMIGNYMQNLAILFILFPFQWYQSLSVKLFYTKVEKHGPEMDQKNNDLVDLFQTL